MYLVLLAGSLPSLRPLFNKRMRTSDNQHASYGYGPRKSHIVLKLSSLPSGRTKAYAGTSNHNDDGSTENILAVMGDGNIMKITEVKVRSGRNSDQGQAGGQQGIESRSANWSNLEVAKIDV